MPVTEKAKRRIRRTKRTRMVHKLGISTDDAVKTVRLVRAGFAFKVGRISLASWPFHNVR